MLASKAKVIGHNDFQHIHDYPLIIDSNNMISVLEYMYVYSFHFPNPFLDFKNAIDDQYEKFDSIKSNFINKDVE